MELKVKFLKLKSKEYPDSPPKISDCYFVYFWILLWTINIGLCEGWEDQLYPVHSVLFKYNFLIVEISSKHTHITHNCRPTRYEYHRKYHYQAKQNIQNIKWAQDSLFRPGWPKVWTGPACLVEAQSRTDGSFTKRTSPVATHKVLASQSRIPALTSHRMMLIDPMGLNWNSLKGIKPNRLFHLFLFILVYYSCSFFIIFRAINPLSP